MVCLIVSGFGRTSLHGKNMITYIVWDLEANNCLLTFGVMIGLFGAGWSVSRSSSNFLFLCSWGTMPSACVCVTCAGVIKSGNKSTCKTVDFTQLHTRTSAATGPQVLNCQMQSHLSWLVVFPLGQKVLSKVIWCRRDFTLSGHFYTVITIM